MSIVPKETIEVIAQSIGISNLSPDAALSLAPDVEYRMREIMQEAIKCMRHSRRTVLTVDDVDGALSLKNVEPVYGFAFGGPLQFKRAIGYKDLFYVDDKDVDLKDIIEAPLPKAPLDTSVHCHWLAIEGVQPTIPENAPAQVIAAPIEGKKHDQKDDGLPIDIKLPIRHVLSRELQLYFEKITELTLRNPDSALFKEALVSLATDSGLHPLVPYFTYFIADEVSRGLSDIPLLFAVMRVVQSLFHNPHVNVEPYLHQLMPAVVTCLVAKKLGKRLSDNHWELRDFVASLVASICKRYAQTYSTLQSRLTRQLVNAFLNPSRVLATQYGAIQGLAALGPNMVSSLQVRLFILPNVEQYLKLLEPEMLLEVQKSKIKRFEARRVYGALLRACGQCVYDRLKILPFFPSPLPGPPLKSNAGVVTPSSRKHKLNGEHSEKQSPFKRMAIDDPVISPPTDTILANNNVPEEATASTAPCISPDIPEKSGEAMASTDATGKEKVKENGFVPSMSVSTIRRQIWKDELDSGRLLVSMFEMFGEGILPFIPSPETSIFL